MTIIPFLRSGNLSLIYDSLSADCVANKMLLTGKNSVISTSISSHLNRNNIGRKISRVITSAKKEENYGKTDDKPSAFPLKVPKKVLAQSVVAILGLGFVDAGYSGDWSRIGAISRETEDLLKLGAFLVVPLCLYFILSFSKKVEN